MAIMLEIPVKWFNTYVKGDETGLNSFQGIFRYLRIHICYTPLLIVWIGINLLTSTYRYGTSIPNIRYKAPWTSSIIRIT